MDIRKLIMVEKEMGLCKEQTLPRMRALPPVPFGMPSISDGHKHRAANKIHPAQPVQGTDRVWQRLWGGIHVSVTVTEPQLFLFKRISKPLCRKV